MKKEVLFILLDEYADWEGAYLASALNTGVMPGNEVKYIARTVAPTLEAVRSIGGFKTLPDYSFNTLPSDYAALALIGGNKWQSDEAERVVPIVQAAMKQGKIIGAICGATSFMAAHGFLNNVKHTGNTVEQLKAWNKNQYTNEANYVVQQAVSDKNIVTANGTANLEFTREMLLLLKADTPENIQSFYNFYKNGFIEYIKP